MGETVKLVQNHEGKLRHIEMAEAEAQAMDDASEGICVACGAVRPQTEPDARMYPCDSCLRQTVFGVQELIIMQYVRFTNG